MTNPYLDLKDRPGRPARPPGHAHSEHAPGRQLPVLAVNAVGCLLMGALLGTGFLGGFTTFSHYTDNVRELVRGDAYGTAAAYLLLTVPAALAGVVLGVFAARAAVGVPAHQEASGGR